MCQTGVGHSMCACLGQSRKRKFIDHPHVRVAARETKLSLSIALSKCWPLLATVDYSWPHPLCSWCYIAWVPNVHCCLKLATEQITNYWDQSLLLFDELATEANRGLIWIHDANVDAKVGARLTKVDKGADKMGSVPLLKIENWSFQVIWQIIDMNLPFFCFSSRSEIRFDTQGCIMNKCIMPLSVCKRKASGEPGAVNHGGWKRGISR